MPENPLCLPGKSDGITDIPFGNNAGMNETYGNPGMPEGQGSPGKPFRNILQIRRIQEILQHILSFWLPEAIDNCQKIQIMITKHKGCPISQIHNITNSVQRFRTSADNVSGQQKLITGRVKRHVPQKMSELVIAAVNIPHTVNRHKNLVSAGKKTLQKMGLSGQGQEFHGKGVFHVPRDLLA